MPSGFGGAGPSDVNGGGGEPMSPEAQVIMMESQRAQWMNEGNSAASIIPPTAITKQVTGEGETPTVPTLPGQ
jgi:hypothetical protein